MISRKWLQRVAVWAILVPVLAAGCSNREQESTAKKAAAEKAGTAAASPEMKKMLVEAASLAPAGAVAVGTLRSPRTLVEDLNELVGPEVATLPAIPLSLLPAGAFDMDAPVAWTFFEYANRPAGVFFMKIKDPTKLSGEQVGDDILKIRAMSPEIYLVKAGSWAAFGSLEAVKAYKASMAGARLAVDEKMAGRIGENLIWVLVNAKPLAEKGRPKLQEIRKAMAAQPATPKTEAEVKAVEWLDNLLGQLDTLEIGVTRDGDRLVTRLGLSVLENSPVLAIARTFKPVDKFDQALPETDRFLMAAWTRLDYTKAVPETKAFLKPLLDLFIAEMDSRLALKDSAGGGNPLRKVFDAELAQADQYPDVLGERAAMLMEIPEPGQGLYRMVKVIDLKDAAKYRVMIKQGAETAQDFLAALSGATPADKKQPKLALSSVYKPAAETVEGVSVDLMRIKIDVQPPEGAPLQQAEMMKNMMASIYGPDGTVTVRMAATDKRAMSVIGGQDLMARAIKHEQGKLGDLAKQKAVAEALARVPTGSSVVAIVSLPACAAAMDGVMSDVFMGMLPADRREVYKSVPLPEIGLPTLAAPTVFSMGVEGRTIQLEMDMPRTEIGGSIPYVRHFYGRVLLFVLEQIPGRMLSGPVGVMKPTAPMPSTAVPPAPRVRS